MRQLRGGIGNRGVAHKWCLERLELEMLHNHLQLVRQTCEVTLNAQLARSCCHIWGAWQAMCLQDAPVRYLQMVDALTDGALRQLLPKVSPAASVGAAACSLTYMLHT